MAEQPPIDWARLDLRYGGRAAFIAKLLAVARQTLAASAGELHVAAARGDMVSLASLAHSLKGTASNIFAAPLADLAAKTERAAREGDQSALALAGNLTDAVSLVLGALASGRSG
jgi:HPt (histidine-containing phosphotransfer) domain-containing protein